MELTELAAMRSLGGDDARWKNFITRRVVRSVTSYTRSFFSYNESANANVHKVVLHSPAPGSLPSYYTKVFPFLGAHRIYPDTSFSQPQIQHQTVPWQTRTKSSQSLLISTKSPLVSTRQLFANDSCPICMETLRDLLRSVSSAINGPVCLPFCSYVLCLHCFAR